MSTISDNVRKLSPNDFPPQLLEIPQPPKELYLVGELPDHDEYVYLAIVGSRKHTSYGKDVVKKLVASLAGEKVVIVSGLAIGIDGIAHQSALEHGLKTIAIPGSGLDDSVIYPRIHLNLAKQIIQAGGALLSEFTPTTRASTWSFPMRNRIMAGLCRAVLIIEAEEKSGTLITARMAVDYNRDVLVVPGNINSPASKGTNQFLRLGATPITCVEDLWEALGIKKEQREVSNEQTHNLSDDEKILFELLTEPMSKDEIFEQTDFDIVQINTILMLLELKNLTKEEFGKIRRI